jgi:hypothetical protein
MIGVIILGFLVIILFGIGGAIITGIFVYLYKLYEFLKNNPWVIVVLFFTACFIALAVNDALPWQK